MHATSAPSRATALLAGCLLAACATAPGEPIGPPTAAVATRTCGPADGPAVSIVLAPSAEAAAAERPPYVRVAIWRAPDEIAGRTWALNGVPDGAAWRHTGPRDFEVATRAAVTVLRVAADTTIDGAVDLAFPSGARVRQAVRAAWRAPDARMLCG